LKTKREYYILKNGSIVVRSEYGVLGDSPSIGEFNLDIIGYSVASELWIELVMIENRLRKEFPDYWQ